MKAFHHRYLKRIVFSIQVITMVIFMSMAYMAQIIPMKYLGMLGIGFLIVGGLEGYLVFKKGDIHSAITQIVCLLLSCFLFVGSVGIYQVSRTVDLLTENNFQKRAISVIVLKDSMIKNEKQIPEHQLGYMSTLDEKTMNYSIEEIEKNVGKIQVKDCKDIKTLIDAFYQKEIDAIILDEAFRKLVENEKESFSEDTRVVYQITKNENSVTAKEVDVTQKPFLVYISGIDEYGELATVSRSDVNMLVALNPVTKQVLLLSIPRDTYFPLHTSGQYDKFTHAGLYGLEESIATLQDMLNEDINYYAKTNFTTFVDIVDAIGGVEVYSPVSFTTVKGKYEIKEGMNQLNAKQALSFVRERKAFADGDFARGRNQQRMISAIVKKICSPVILTSFSSILDTVSRSVETNMSSSQINALIQMQLSDMPSWDIQSYQIIGTPDNQPCYSVGGASASVIVPDEQSLKEATQYIDQLVANEIIQTDAGDLNQKEE